jgi:hypothetical protein
MLKEVSTDGKHPRVLNRGVDSFDQWGVQLGKFSPSGHPGTSKQSITGVELNSPKNFIMRYQNKEESRNDKNGNWI